MARRHTHTLLRINTLQNCKTIRDNALSTTKPFLSPHATNNYRSDIDGLRAFAELQAVHATVNAKLRTVGEHTGATLLDPLPDICGSGDGCLPFFGAGEPKFSDNVHLRPVFVREHLRFLDPLLK